MKCFPRSVGSDTRVLAAILLRDATDVQMAHHVVLERHVLADYEPKYEIMLVSEYREKQKNCKCC